MTSGDMMFDYSNFPRNAYLCCDVKSFYASAAAIKLGLDPLVSKLAVVGDTNRNGSVVLAATPELKKLGIKTGSRLYEIPKLDDIVVVDAEMEEYLKLSTEITKLLNTYVPMEDIFVYSVDEAFIAITSSRWKERQEDFARMIQEDIKNQFGLTVAIGSSSCNMLLSKLSLDIEAKKSGFAHWDYEDVREKVWPISPLSDMWGIGSKLEQRLRNMGIRKVEHIANASLPVLERVFGKVIGQQLYQHAWGIDLSDIHKPAKTQSKSYSIGQVLLRDYQGEELNTLLVEQAEEVARRARKEHAAGRTITLGLGYSRYEGGGGFSRSLTLPESTNVTMDIYEAALSLLKRYYRGEIVRHMHLALSNVGSDDERQLSLFEEEKEVTKKRKLGYIMDSIRDKYGATSLLRASSYTDAGTVIHRSGLIAGHKK